jgi:hypothetical protein
MSSYDHLKTLLELRRAAEASAERALAAESLRRVEVQNTQRGLDAALDEARAALQAQRALAAAITVESADRALLRQRFWARLDDAVRACAARASEHRQDRLRPAESAEAAARATHLAARRQREAVEEQRARALAARAQLAARREEQAQEEQAEATRAAARSHDR